MVLTNFLKSTIITRVFPKDGKSKREAPKALPLKPAKREGKKKRQERKRKIIKIILKNMKKIIHFGVVGIAAAAVVLTSLVGLVLAARPQTPRRRLRRSITTGRITKPCGSPITRRIPILPPIGRRPFTPTTATSSAL